MIHPLLEIFSMYDCISDVDMCQDMMRDIRGAKRALKEQTTLNGKNVPNSGSIVFYIGCGFDTNDQETLREADTEPAQ